MIAMRATFVVYILFIFAITAPLSAGSYAFDFLDLGVGTRAKALGGSFVSIADDGSSLLWNPAGTSQVRSSRFYFMHNSNFSGYSTVDYISFIKPIVAQSFFSVAVIRHSVGEIPIFPELEGTPEERDTTSSLQGDGNPLGYFGETAHIYFINLSKLIKLKAAHLSLGGNFKYFDETMYSTTGTGIGLDIGTIVSFSTAVPGQFGIGLNLQDATGTQILWNTASQRKDIIPTNYSLGFHYKKQIHKLHSQFLITYDYHSRYGGSHHSGFEYSYRDYFLLQLGLNQTNWSFGTGIHFWKIGIQYGFISHTLGSSHVMSMEFLL